MNRAKSVTIIPATVNHFSKAPYKALGKRKVAGYARVSSDNDEQLTSYEAQVDYYTNHILSNPDWKFVKVYTDEGISATSTKRREGFNRMIKDALAGKIDLIITKSVSRFARNTVDSLTTVRKLKEKGIEIYFEKENIWTLDSKGELLITIMSSLAQEESRSISENVTWGIRKQFQDGKVSLPYGRFLGYDKGEDGLPKINEKEAATVRLIYRMFLEGATPYKIARHLTSKGILSPGGKDRWLQATVKSILTNEKYKGDALLQKTITVDFLTKRKKENEGEVPQYYVENSHPAIIEPEVYDMVQREMERRGRGKSRYSGVDIFASKIVCSECGGSYGPKVWHSNSKYRRVIYQCNNKFKRKDKCETPHLDEETIKSLFIKAVNKLLTNKEGILLGLQAVKQKLSDTLSLDNKHVKLKNEMAVVGKMIERCINENAKIAKSQDEYRKEYEGLASRFQELKKELNEVDKRREKMKAKGDILDAFIVSLKRQEGLISEFDKRLWYALVDKVVVYNEDDVRFRFRDGMVLYI